MAYNYYPNNQYYMQDLQNMKERIDKQMQQMQQMNQNQMQQQPPTPTNLTQTFQLAPQINSNSELQCQYADNIEQVKNTFVMKNAIFVTKDLSTMWQKDVSGNIRTFKTEEVVELDEKDREILDLQRQVNELKGMIANESNGNSTIIDEPNESKTTTKLSSRSKSNAK